MLNVNEERTELIIFNPKHHVRISEELWLQVGNKIVSVESSVTKLGVYFNTSLAMERSKCNIQSLLLANSL